MELCHIHFLHLAQFWRDSKVGKRAADLEAEKELEVPGEQREPASGPTHTHTPIEGRLPM